MRTLLVLALFLMGLTPVFAESTYSGSALLTAKFGFVVDTLGKVQKVRLVNVNMDEDARVSRAYLSAAKRKIEAQQWPTELDIFSTEPSEQFTWFLLDPNNPDQPL
jgi:hypothetical protein